MGFCAASERPKGFVTLHFSPLFHSGPKMVPHGDRLKEEFVDGSPPGPASLSSEGLKEQSAACTFTCA